MGGGPTGQIGTLADVLEYYNRAPAAPAGHSELQPLGLAPEELAALETFLRSLDEEASTSHQSIVAKSIPDKEQQ